MKIAVVGATGLVGGEILEVMEERNVQFDELLLVASARSAGTKKHFKGKEYVVITPEEAVKKQPDFAIFSAGGGTSLEWAPRFAAAGTTVIDNSSAWRMSPDHQLVVPEINANQLTSEDRIIANPNCSTIQMVLALAPLHKCYTIRRVVVSTYQSVTGSGKAAVDQMMNERQGKKGEMAYPHQIDMNALPHIDTFLDNGYTKEEMKMVNETKKILGDDSIQLTATTVRIPAVGGHSESVNVEFEKDYDLAELRQILEDTPGLIVQDKPAENHYPMPLTAHKKDEVFVGRLRRDESQPNTLNMWIVADNLRKGAATNAVQIAEYLIKHESTPSMKFELKTTARNVPDDLLIKDLVTVAKKMNKNSVTQHEYNQEGKYNAATYGRRFGSWPNALEKAGLEKNINPKPSEEDLFKNIEEVWIKLGRQPRYEEVKTPLSKYHAATYGRHFGNWGKALKKFLSYINADKLNEEESAKHSPNEITSVDDTSVKIFKHKTKRNISFRLRFRILMRDGFTCKKCGRSPLKEKDVELHVDHIIPWSKGGETLPENLETKCSRCNLGKGNAFNE